jgi:hypothetical protein
MVEVKLSPRQERWAAAGMAAVAGLMLISLFYQVGMHLVWRSWLNEATATLAAPTTQPAATQPATTEPAAGEPASTQPAGSQPTGSQPASAPAVGRESRKKDVPPIKLASAITRRNIFQPPRPTGHGLTLTGVIGKIALFASRDGNTVGIQEGQSEQGVKVVAIRNYEVTIEHKGKQETLKLFDGGGMGGGGGPAAPDAGPEIRPGGEMQIPEEVRAAMKRMESDMGHGEVRARMRAMRMNGDHGAMVIRESVGSEPAP